MTEDAVPAPDTAVVLQQQLDQANRRLVHAELKSHAIRAGIIDLDCLKMLDISKIKVDDDGNVPEAEETLGRLRRDKPWLFSAANSSQPAPAPTPEPPKLRSAREMTHKEWQAARERLIRNR